MDREALTNIVDNAIKYTEHGTIQISAVSYEKFARIDISDTGIGLYLTRQIISGEGGYIKVASVPGKGSTFSIFLPK